MTSIPIVELPKDLQLCLAEFLQPHDLKNLACTCASLHNLLLDLLYRKDIKSGRCRALSWACQFSNLPTLKRSLGLGAPKDHKIPPWPYMEHHDNSSGTTRLADLGDLDRISIPEDLCRGLSPLLVAVSNNHLEIVRHLLDNEADPNLPFVDRSGVSQTPLQWTMNTLSNGRDESKKRQYDILKALLEGGADPNLLGGPDRRGYLPLHRSLKRTYGLSECPVEVTRLLLLHGANILHCRPRQDAIIKHLIYNEVCTPASDTLFAQKLNLVLEHYPGMVKGMAWNRALAAILDTLSPRMLELLKVVLARGCSCDCLLPSGETKSPIPIRRISEVIAKSFIGFKCEGVKYAVEMLRELLEAGADPNGWREEDEPRTHSALWALVSQPPAFRELVRAAALLLLEKGANPNINEGAHSCGHTLLQQACSWGGANTSFIQLLLQFGADPNAVDGEGHSVLYYAVEFHKNRQETVELLLQYGAVVSDHEIKTKPSGIYYGNRKIVDRDVANLLLRYQQASRDRIPLNAGRV